MGTTHTAWYTGITFLGEILFPENDTVLDKDLVFCDVATLQTIV